MSFLELCSKQCLCQQTISLIPVLFFFSCSSFFACFIFCFCPSGFSTGIGLGM